MSISSLASTQTRIESCRTAARQAAASGSSFQAQLAQTSAAVQGPAIHLRMPNENCVFSGAHKGRNRTMQEIYAEYTAGSTPENPVVHVSGTADSGPFDFTCRIKDIDPSGASYAELAALFGHLEKTGVFQSGHLSSRVIPTGLRTGDITEKRDYLGLIERHQYDRRFGDTCKAQASELLALYRPYASGTEAPRSASTFDHSAFMKTDLLSALADFKTSALERMEKAKKNEEDQEAWEKLMKYLDAWIESLREGKADVQKSARAYAGLQDELTKDNSGRKDLGDYLLEQLEQSLAL